MAKETEQRGKLDGRSGHHPAGGGATDLCHGEPGEAWYAAVAASNAANYGMRVGSVSQANPAANAVAATQGRLDAISVGTYAISASGRGYRGAQVNVLVDWAVPNYTGILITYIGGGDQMNFEGTALSTFRQERWGSKNSCGIARAM